jgi:hypothetical protein
VARSEPPVPYLAAIPVSEPPPRRRWRRIAGAAGAGAVAAVLVVVALVAIPVAHASAQTFTMNNPGSLTALTHAVTFPRSGTFTFTWSTTNGGTVTFTVLGSGGVTIYASSSAASGGGTLAVSEGTPYTFEILDWLPEVVDVTGTLSYQAPLL